jgi:hypothetical protein
MKTSRDFFSLVAVILFTLSAYADDSPKLDEDMALLDGIGGRMGMMRTFARGGAWPGVTYSGWYAPQGNPGATSFNSLNASSLIYKSDHDAISLFTSGSDFHIDSPPTLPNGLKTPADLGRIEAGLRYTAKIDEKTAWGGGLGFGSASDRPFSSSDVDTYSVNAFYSMTTTEHSTWVFTLFYSNNNPIMNNIPIPGFMYIYRAEKVVVMAGLPFAMVLWRPVEPWAFTASIFGPLISVEADYGHRSQLQGFVGYRSTEQSYLRANRPDESDRVQEVDKRAYAGLRFPLAQGFGMELQGGYAFDRFIGESDFSFHSATSPTNSANLGNSWYAATSLRFGF